MKFLYKTGVLIIIGFFSVLIFSFIQNTQFDGDELLLLPKPVDVRKTSNTVNGKPWDELDIIVPSGGNFGRDPYIVVYPNSDNTVTVAWLDRSIGKIRIMNFDQHDSISEEVICKNLPQKNTELEGFTKMSDSGDYIVGFTKPNSKNDGTEYWLMRMNFNGDSIWSNRIFGGKSMKEKGAKCCPGSGGTARIVYNPKTKNIGFFLGHSQKWSDGITHQASYLGFMTSEGVRLKPGNSWYISHDMDQRMIVVDSLYYLLSHGDAYPRALVFSVWSDSEKINTNNLVFTEYFKISGKIGDNYTGTRTGGIIPLSDGNFGIVFASEIGRKRMDICFVKISKKGKVLLTKWFTNNTNNNAEIPKIASRGKNRILLAWKPDWTSTNFWEIDNNGNILTKKTIIKDYDNENTNIRLCMTHDFVTCPNGDIVWASGDYRNEKLNIYRIKY